MNHVTAWMQTIAGYMEDGTRRGAPAMSVVALVAVLTVLQHQGQLPLTPPFLAFFAGVFLLGALYRPWWAFLVFVALLPLEAINLAPASWGVTVRPYQAAGALTILALGIRAVTGRLPRRLPRWHVADAAMLLFGGSGFLAIAGSDDVRAALLQAVIMTSCVGWYFLARYFVRGPVTARAPVIVLLLSTAVTVVYGLWQNIAFLHGWHSGEVMPGRPNALLPEPDWLGTYLAMVLALGGALLYTLRHTWRHMTIVTIAAVPIVALLLATVARSAWLAAAAAGATGVLVLGVRWWVLRRADDRMARWHADRLMRTMPRLVAVVLVTVALAWYAVAAIPLSRFDLMGRAQSTASGRQEITIACVPQTDTARIARMSWEQVTDTLCHGDAAQCACRHIDLEVVDAEKAAGNTVLTVLRNDPSAAVRGDVYRAAAELLREHWLLGMGWGQSGRVLGTDARGAALNTSNILLETWLGAGLLGLLALLVAVGDVIWRAIRVIGGRDFRPDDWQVAYALGTLLAITALLVANMFNAGAYLGFLWVLLGAVAHGAVPHPDQVLTDD